MLIRPVDKKTRCRIIAESITPPFEVKAYGSRVNGSAHYGSDIDPVIRKQGLEKIDNEELGLLKEQIGESNVPVLVEIRD